MLRVIREIADLAAPLAQAHERDEAKSVRLFDPTDDPRRRRARVLAAGRVPSAGEQQVKVEDDVACIANQRARLRQLHVSAQTRVVVHANAE